jgi:hypothetical protein
MFTDLQARMKKILIFLFLIIGPIACSSDNDEQITIYDDYLKKQIISELQKENISFTESAEGVITYSRKDSSRVDEIFNQEIKRLPVRYSFVSEEQALASIEFLESENIEYYVSGTKQKYNIWVDKKYGPETVKNSV